MLRGARRQSKHLEKGQEEDEGTHLNWLTTVCATFCDGVVQIGSDVLVMLSAVKLSEQDCERRAAGSALDPARASEERKSGRTCCCTE